MKNQSERVVKEATLAHLAVMVLVELLPHFFQHFRLVWRPRLELVDDLFERLCKLLTHRAHVLHLLNTFLHLLYRILLLAIHQLLDKLSRLLLVQETRLVGVFSRKT